METKIEDVGLNLCYWNKEI